MSIIKFTTILLVLSFNLIKADEVILQNCINHNDYIKSSIENKLEFERLEKFTQDFINNGKINDVAEYVIPVVFHVFGTDFEGKEVNLDIIKAALHHTNKDFQGYNSDYETSDPAFDDVKSKLQIRFELAKFDPLGNPTDGVTFHDPAVGLAIDDNKANSIIKEVAWDNSSYMNVYICLDLNGDGVKTNSGYAFYPNNSMSNAGTARVVYNGRYLFGNTNPKFASTLSHEFGHWLNLLHTFEGGCTYPNDYVEDTPPVDKPYMGCPSINCENNPINAENFMDYNTQCYSMFTEGQVVRMKAALEFNSRKSLWQIDNLKKVGLYESSSVKNYNNDVNVFPNPITNGILNITNNDNRLVLNEIIILDLIGNKVKELKNINSLKSVNVEELESGVYILNIQTNYGIINKKLLIQKK